MAKCNTCKDTGWIDIQHKVTAKSNGIGWERKKCKCQTENNNNKNNKNDNNSTRKKQQ